LRRGRSQTVIDAIPSPFSQSSKRLTPAINQAFYFELIFQTGSLPPLDS
jgi:hypothetical protein